MHCVTSSAKASNPRLQSLTAPRNLLIIANQSIFVDLQNKRLIDVIENNGLISNPNANCKYPFTKERSVHNMTDSEFRALAETANKSQNIRTVADLITWLQQFPSSTEVAFGYATIEAYIDDINGSQTILVEELA
mgnify:FL=1